MDASDPVSFLDLLRVIYLASSLRRFVGEGGGPKFIAVFRLKHVKVLSLLFLERLDFQPDGRVRWLTFWCKV